MSAGLAAFTVPLPAQDQPFVFTGLPIVSPKFEMIIDLAGYSDSGNDRRTKFLGREYLSGDWAGAIYYEGGNLPAQTRWFPERFVFPDFYTYDPMTEAPHFQTSESFMAYGPNSEGFNAYGSYIMNDDFKISMRYEMRDCGTNMTDRLALGLVRHSLGGTGDFLRSQRYVYQQTYTFENVSGQALSNVKFYQFLHTLHGDWGVYDGREYGGETDKFFDYRFGMTLQGESYGFNLNDYSTVKFTDTVAMKYSTPPFGYKVGAFGMKATDSHQTGEPDTGIHKSVAMNNLNPLSDFFDPDENNPAEDAWAAAAVSFDLGGFSVNQTKTIDVLLAVHSSYETIYPPINLVVHNVKLEDSLYTIDFEEKTHNPLVGYLLRKSATLDPIPETWQQVGVPYIKDIPFLNWARFQAPVNTMENPRLFFVIQPVILNED